MSCAAISAFAHLPRATDDAEERLIPRVVYQISIGQEVPEPLRAVRDSLIRSNPNWTFILLAEAAIERFIAEHYGQSMLDRYYRIRPEYNVARADLARYLLIYRLGGVYLDLKSTVDRVLDEVILPYDYYIISQWRNRRGEEHFNWGFHPGLGGVQGGALQQWFVASVPGHPFLEAVIREVCGRIDCYNAWRDEVGASGVFKLTGPVAYTKAIWPIRHNYPHRLIRDETEAGLVYSVMSGLSHRALSSGHYASRRTPIVGSVLTGAAGLALRGWQHVRDRPWVWWLRARRIEAWLVRRMRYGN